MQKKPSFCKTRTRRWQHARLRRAISPKSTANSTISFLNLIEMSLVSLALSCRRCFTRNAVVFLNLCLRLCALVAMASRVVTARDIVETESSLLDLVASRSSTKHAPSSKPHVKSVPVVRVVPKPKQAAAPPATSAVKRSSASTAASAPADDNEAHSPAKAEAPSKKLKPAGKEAPPVTAGALVNYDTSSSEGDDDSDK